MSAGAVRCYIQQRNQLCKRSKYRRITFVLQHVRCSVARREAAHMTHDEGGGARLQVHVHRHSWRLTRLASSKLFRKPHWLTCPPQASVRDENARAAAMPRAAHTCPIHRTQTRGALAMRRSPSTLMRGPCPARRERLEAAQDH